MLEWGKSIDLQQSLTRENQFIQIFNLQTLFIKPTRSLILQHVQLYFVQICLCQDLVNTKRLEFHPGFSQRLSSNLEASNVPFIRVLLFQTVQLVHHLASHRGSSDTSGKFVCKTSPVLFPLQKVVFRRKLPFESEFSIQLL